MLLDKINSPKDLDKLSYKELDQLSEEIRTFIVETVEDKGGHLGSNLGIVELTIALHRALEAPKDKILFDTGHQAYVHKILTGRKDQFSTLRQAGGLSGYPSRAESEYDWIENSHASTVLSYAHGLATAQKHNSDPNRIVAVVGDGSLTGGLAYEGLNNLGHSRSNVTIIFNDNGRSYAPTISLLSQSLAKIRANPKYVKRQKWLENSVAKLPFVGKFWHTGIQSGKAAVRQALEPMSFFEPLGVRYIGPFDGHDIKELEEVISQTAHFDGPTVIHVLTQKGRGYAPAENDEIKNMHDLGAVKTGSYTEAFSKAVVSLAEKHEDIVAITAAMPDSTGLLPFRDKFPDRFIDVGIAEAHAVTAANAMAIGGLRPVVAVYSTFLTRAFDQVNLDVGLSKQPVIFCLDRAGITGDDGPSHHGVLDLVLLSKVPGMTIFCPSTYDELGNMLNEAYKITSGPSCIRWPKTPPIELDLKPGSGLQATQISAGKDICVIAFGNMLKAALEAEEILKNDNIDITIWDPRIAKPLDSTMLEDAANHRIVVTIEDGLAQGGIGSQIKELIASNKTVVEVLGVPTEYIAHGNVNQILESLGLSGEGIVKAIKNHL